MMDHATRSPAQPPHRLTEVMTGIADQARPARIPPDIWQRGVRRRRARVASAVLAALVVLAGAPLLLNLTGGGSSTSPAHSPEPVVPSTVYSPWTGQDTINEDPPGPAAILVTGDNELRGSDIWGYEGRSLLVAQDGSYRLARTVGETTAGAGGLLLSPDGRYLAGPAWIEGSDWPDDLRDPVAVFDLTNGKIRQYDGGTPMLWAPDGGSLLLHAYPPGGQNPPARLGTLNLLDLRTGKTRKLPKIEGNLREGNFAAFSPDGARLAVATGDALYVIELDSNKLTRLAGFTDRERLAGPGAWLPDGDRIAIYHVAGCTDGEPCDERSLGQRLFQVSYLDASTGREVSGPRLAPAQGVAARLLGWQRDGAAVVVVHSPEKGASTTDETWSETDWWAVGGVTLKRFDPAGGQRELVDLPDSALFVDVPTELLDRFGGPAPSPLEGAARWLLARLWPIGQFIELAILLSTLIVVIVWRWRRRLRLPPRPAQSGHDDG